MIDPHSTPFFTSLQVHHDTLLPSEPHHCTSYLLIHLSNDLDDYIPPQIQEYF